MKIPKTIATYKKKYSSITGILLKTKKRIISVTTNHKGKIANSLIMLLFHNVIANIYSLT